eukprot:TRINITY_DN1760_c0_g1_i4.p1 TRINITY_DN1760_c0_g1~~TRINITY_DN1760_c0_g1_i4.p1  ORF type:complete len:182 (-),score=48.15 TRINITY_DN1760_c0_g1_i4:36-581(-)
MNHSILAETFFLIGDFNLDYYFNLKDSTDLLHFDVCDVGYTVFNFTKNILSKMSMFSNFLADDVPTQISSILGTPSFQQELQLPVFPLIFLYPAFEEELIYDPDFTILLPGNNNGGSGEGGGTGGKSDGESSRKITIAVAVVIPVVAILIGVGIVVGVVGGLLVAKYRRDKYRSAIKSFSL